MALRLGVIGYGMSAADIISAGRYAPGWDAVCAGGRNREKAQAFAAEHGVEAGTAEELIARDDIDVVAISTPPAAHKEYALQALRSGKHVIVEKPMAITVAECDEIIKTAKECGRLVMVAQTQRFYGNALKAKELIDAGAIGTVLMIHEHMYDNSFGNPAAWHYDPAISGGGVVYNTIPHLIDRIRHFCGAGVASVFANVGYHNPGWPNADGNAQVFMKMDNGASASILYHGYNAKMEKFSSTVCGSEGIIELAGFNRQCRVFKNGEERVETAGTSKKNDTDPVNEGYLNLFNAWAEAISAGTDLPSAGEDGRANVAVCQAILASSESGQVVLL